MTWALPFAAVLQAGTKRRKLLRLWLAAMLLVLQVTCGGSGSAPTPASKPTPASTIPASLFGMAINNSSGAFPTISFGIERFWDTTNSQWPAINTALNVYNWSTLDSLLAVLKTSGVTEAFYTLSRTPNWASSNPTDTNCNYYAGTTGAEAAGQCDLPTDLNPDGSGSNTIWKIWVNAIAQHANNPTYLQTHAHIKYWEPWNEYDRSSILESNGFNQAFQGTYAQLVRLTEDARCIILGKGIVHNYPVAGQSTPCTATAIDPTAKIVMASAHATAEGLDAAQNFLYCNSAPKTGSQCSTGSAGAQAVDIINMHMKPGNNPSTPIEDEMITLVNNTHGILQAAELAKAFWNGESGYSGGGWTGSYRDVDMKASFVPRYFLMNWSLGVSSISWYTWDSSNLLVGNPTAIAAWTQTYNWMVGATLFTHCAANGAVWTCGLTRSGGYQAQAIWDNSQSCSGGVCTTAIQTVGSQYLHYRDLAGNTTPIVNHTVPVGIKPILLENL